MTARLLKQIQRAKSAEKVQKFLKELPDHNEANENGDTLLHAFVRRRDKYSQDCLWLSWSTDSVTWTGVITRGLPLSTLLQS
ncbi:hypothetical protein GBAR_LOCUS21021 [Geodia barretti]|uniref:Uncharacterized protein n=1 Tax=Geodia barretti TaxID=519541 RepID=A0AA35X4B0_GEOBA|nr:hypothetical protein GBAR_LOCUS21021 [Geodia barretti]